MRIHLNLSKRLLGFTAYVTLGLLAGSLSQPALASPVPVTTDLWDVSQGVEITAHSGVIGTSSIRNMFGATEGRVETAGLTLFRDDQLSGFVHFVEWRTPLPIHLESFSLFANHDGVPRDANERGFRRFTLLARSPATMQFETLFDFFPTNRYQHGGGPHFHLVSANLTPIVAQEFRAEFEQFGDRTPSARGPRIRELDGFGIVVPEPSSGAILVAGLYCAMVRRRRAE